MDCRAGKFRRRNRCRALGWVAWLLLSEHARGAGDYPPAAKNDVSIAGALARGGVVSPSGKPARRQLESGGLGGAAGTPHSLSHRTDEAKLHDLAKRASAEKTGFPFPSLKCALPDDFNQRRNLNLPSGHQAR